MPKKKVTWFVYKKVNLVLIVVVAALVGSVGTAQLTGTQAAAYPGYFSLTATINTLHTLTTQDIWVIP